LKLSFKLVITREDSLDRVEQLKTALQRLGIDSQNALFVGNTEKDSAAAKDVRCQFMRVGE
jgi:phosphoglycolate phosphatase-like HAD superfamily hydrolase